MKQFFKKHIGIAVLLVIILAFPVSLSTQARLNMRIIVTGIGIDKTDNGYEITAQIVKTQPSAGASGESASIEFISEQGETIVSAISKLSYKSGKVAGFSHTNFILLGSDMLEENLLKPLNYFLRDTTIKDSALLLFAGGKAKDELQKTKDLGLSVGLGLQKVFVYKQKESDGAMTTLLSFVNSSLDKSKTATVSVLELDDGTKSSEENEEKMSSNKQSTESENQEASKEDGESSGGSEGGQSQEEQSQGESGTSSESQTSSKYFKSQTPVKCFVTGKYVGSFEAEDEIAGLMFSRNECKSDDLSIENINFEGLKNASVGVEIKYKTCKKKIRFENEKPVVDIIVNIEKSSIKEIQSDEFLATLSNSEFEHIKSEIKKTIASKIATAFEKSKEMKADIFDAYDYAYKFKYGKIKNKFSTMEEFLDEIKLNVEVNVNRLEY